MDKYSVSGMHCAACSARVEKAVSKVDGVTVCSVNLLTNSMGVEGTADAQRAGFDPLIERFTAELSARAEESRGKNRVYTACSLFFGVCAVIIFL